MGSNCSSTCHQEGKQAGATTAMRAGRENVCNTGRLPQLEHAWPGAQRSTIYVRGDQPTTTKSSSSSGNGAPQQSHRQPAYFAPSCMHHTTLRTRRLLAIAPRHQRPACPARPGRLAFRSIFSPHPLALCNRVMAFKSQHETAPCQPHLDASLVGRAPRGGTAYRLWQRVACPPPLPPTRPVGPHSPPLLLLGRRRLALERDLHNLVEPHQLQQVHEHHKAPAGVAVADG